jgi:preprotein translocase subunit SecB
MSEEKQPQFAIQRIYIKDLSFEGPNSPEIFQKDWKPDLKVDLDTSSRKLDGDFYESTLKITVKVKSSDQEAFICEVEQAGIFTVLNFTDEQREHLLGSICSEILFPYAREAISDAVSKGGFPQLLLAPINFEAYFQEKKKQSQSA